MQYQVGTKVQIKGYKEVGTITEIRPLGRHITGTEPLKWVRVRPGLDWTKEEFQRMLETGDAEIKEK